MLSYLLSCCCTSHFRPCPHCWQTMSQLYLTVWGQVLTWSSRTTPSAGTSSSPSSSPPPSSPPLGMVTLLLSQYQVGCFYFIPSPLNTDWLQVAGSAWSMPLLVSPCVCPYWQTLVRFWQQLSARWLSSTRCLLYQYLRNITWLLKRKSMSQDYLAFFLKFQVLKNCMHFMKLIDHGSDWFHEYIHDFNQFHKWNKDEFLEFDWFHKYFVCWIL